MDPEVAARIVEEGPRLGAEDVEVTVMFTDIRDFTGYAETREPNAVVALVNGLFELVIRVIHEHGRLRRQVRRRRTAGGLRLEYSVIGDTVNVAARVEAATRQTGDTVLVSEHTRRLLGDGAVRLVQREAVSMKGKRARGRVRTRRLGLKWSLRQGWMPVDSPCAS